MISVLLALGISANTPCAAQKSVDEYVDFLYSTMLTADSLDYSRDFYVRNVEKALGDGKKHVSPSEAKNKAIARKSIVAAKPIQKGEVFTEENITTKRPGDGVSPMRWHEVLGKTAKRDFAEDEKIEL